MRIRRQKALIVGITTSNPRKGMTLTKVDVKDETGYAKLVFFNGTIYK